MNRNELYLDKLTSDLIELKGYLRALQHQAQEISGKLDTIIALKQVELSLRPPTPDPQSPQEPL